DKKMKATFKTITKRISLSKMTDTVTLWFFGDVHRDTRNCDVDRWHWFLKKAKESMDENTYFFLMGDPHDFASTREKNYLKQAAVHESTINVFDDIAERNNREFADEISFMRGRLLGVVEGNHSWLFENGKTSDEDLAERMDSEDIGWLCHYSLIFSFGDRHAVETHAIHLVLCHGKAGGKLPGTSINQVDDLRKIFPIADLYCMGHDHQREAKPVSVIVPAKCKDGFKLKQKRQYLCRSGAFLKGYQSDSSSYEIFRLYKPSDLGALKMTVNFHRDQSNNSDRIITDICSHV
ncbi:MAG: hypothetical protein KKC37_17085, partial [Proteobacteria bacterium]|nr:hypothetical protein [Pseudomonadota bacterium]